MFGTFTRPQGNDSPTEEVKEAAIAEEVVETTPEVETESDTVENESQESTEDDAAKDDGSEETQDDDEVTEEVKKPKKGFERRIERFNQKLSAKDQEIEYWKKAALGGAKEEVRPVQHAPEGKPVFSEYNDIETFTEALTDWKVQQALSGMTQKQQVENVVKTYETRLNEFKKITPDFQDVLDEFVEDYGDKTVPEIVQVAMESEVGPAIAYYLAKNTSEVERIAALPPHRRLIELGKLEDRLSTPKEITKKDPKEETKKISKASPPAESVKTPGKVETRSLYDDELPYDQWVKLRTKKK